MGDRAEGGEELRKRGLGWEVAPEDETKQQTANDDDASL